MSIIIQPLAAAGIEAVRQGEDSYRVCIGGVIDITVRIVVDTSTASAMVFDSVSGEDDTYSPLEPQNSLRAGKECGMSYAGITCRPPRAHRPRRHEV